MRRLWTVGLAVGAATAALGAVFCLSSSEPVYAGKRITEWLEAGSEPAAMAVHAIGPRSTPWILKKVRWEHPRWGKWEVYQMYWRRVPKFARTVLPTPRVAAYDEYKAAMALLEVGPEVLPQLTSALRENNPAVRITCAMALGALGERARNNERTQEALRVAAGDAHPEVRQQIATLIAGGGQQQLR